MRELGPGAEDRRRSSAKGQAALERFRSVLKDGSEGREVSELNEYEATMLAEVVHPDEIEVGFQGERFFLEHRLDFGCVPCWCLSARSSPMRLRLTPFPPLSRFWSQTWAVWMTLSTL